MKYVTFYTSGYYEKVYNEYLRPSAEAVNLDIRAYKEHNYHDWGLNTRMKARVIDRALLDFDDIVWLDSDASVKKYPELFDKIPEKYDLAVYYLDWSRHWEGKLGGHKRELVNSVMMMRNRPIIKSIVKEWIKKNDTTSHVWEQQLFQDILERHKDIKTYILPDEYCTILTRDNTIPDYVKDPVIVQNQISRKVRQDRMLLQ